MSGGYPRALLPGSISGLDWAFAAFLPPAGVIDINRRVGRLKTKNVDRLVPLHGAILSDLLKYTEGRPRGVNLWGLTANRFGTVSAALSGRLNSALDRACPENNGPVTYSVRHTFATRLKYAEYRTRC